MMVVQDDSGAKHRALSKDRILDLLSQDLPRLPVLEIESAVDSTNDHLARLRAGGHPVDVVVADAQSAGRGRRGRRWISPPNAGLYLSFFWSCDRPSRQLSLLSLVAGLAAAEAVEQCCGLAVGLKWPNDLQIDGRKVAGCLVEAGGAANAATAIIGIGINIDFGHHIGPDQPWTDLASAAGRAPDRNQLAATLITRLVTNLSEFDRLGFVALRPRWARRDVLLGRRIEASGQGRATMHGRAAGLDEDGHLLLEQRGKIQRLHAGEVSLRK